MRLRVLGIRVDEQEEPSNGCTRLQSNDHTEAAARRKVVFRLKENLDNFFHFHTSRFEISRPIYTLL